MKLKISENGRIKTKLNENSKWLHALDKSYCTSNDYNISQSVLDHAINKSQISKATGEDKITDFWNEKINRFRDFLPKQFNAMLYQSHPLANWLSTAYTVFLPKNTDMHIPKKYRPIACPNIFYKLYTSCINSFLMDLVNRITPE